MPYAYPGIMFLWGLVYLAVIIFVLSMVIRFVRAHERLAEAAERIAGQDFPKTGYQPPERSDQG